MARNKLCTFVKFISQHEGFMYKIWTVTGGLLNLTPAYEKLAGVLFFVLFFLRGVVGGFFLGGVGGVLCMLISGALNNLQMSHKISF